MTGVCRISDLYLLSQVLIAPMTIITVMTVGGIKFTSIDLWA